MISKILNKLFGKIDSNWGYSTPSDVRFDVGDICAITEHKTNGNPFEIGEIVYILETGRHDYLVENINGVKHVIYQYEITLILF